jgi:serine/threonine-protein kinase
MEGRVKQGGRAARDPGNNALGQGYLALGEIEKAKEHLQLAWESGYQLPSTAYALGQTMGLLFQKKLNEVERTPSEEVRTRLKEEYEKEFRDPAVRYLKQAEGSVESPAYVEGLIALYEKRFDDALRKAKEASAKSQWSYDAKTLEGKSLLGQAQKKFETADYKGFIQQASLAGNVFARAADLGRSRADIYLNDCERLGKIIEAQTYTGDDPAITLRKAEDACNNAILINPDDPAPYLRKSHLYNRLVRYQLYSGSDDPRPLLKKSIETANEAARRDSASWEPHHMLLNSHMLAGEYEVRHGIDPKNELNEAIHQGNLALKIGSNPGVFYNLGATYVLVGEYETQTGKNPVPTYRKAIQYYEQIPKADKSMRIGNEIGIAYWFISTYQRNHGEDPSESFRNSIEAFQNFLKTAPDDPYVLYNLGIVYTDQGNHELSLGKDPILSFQKAQQVKQQASKFLPNNSYILNGIGYDHVLMADFLVSKGKDPTSELNEGRKFLKEASKVDANYYMPNTNLGYAEIVNGDWAIKQGQSPIAFYEAARKAYLKSIELNKEEPETYRSIAEVYSKQAEWEIQQKRPANDSIAKGLELVGKSLKMGGENPDGLAIQGALFLLQAKISNTSEERVRYASAAVTAFEKALKSNSLLRKDYEPRLKEAKAMRDA